MSPSTTSLPAADCRRVLIVCSFVGLAVALSFVRGQESDDPFAPSRAKPEVEEKPKQPDFPVRLTVEPVKRDGPADQRIVVTLTIENGYHLYANPTGNEDLQPQTVLTVSSKGKPEVVKITYPKGEVVKNEIVGDYRIYTGTVSLEVITKRVKDDQSPLVIAVRVRPMDHRGCRWPTRALTAEIP